MSIQVLQSEVSALAPGERRKLMALMVALEDGSRTDYAASLAQKIDDTAPGRWLTPEQCERELGLDCMSDSPLKTPCLTGKWTLRLRTSRSGEFTAVRRIVPW